MAMTPWEPFEPMDTLRQAIDRLFRERFVPSWLAPTQFVRMIPVDVTETGNEYVIEASLPGFRKEDFQITATGNRLTIRATKEETKEEKKAGYIRHERYEGEVARSIELPTAIAFDKVSATYESGVLTLHAPKVEAARAKVIEVKVKEAVPAS